MVICRTSGQRLGTLKEQFMARREKCTEEIKLHLGEKLKADLKEMAAMEGHDSLSPYIRQILRYHVYGKLSPHRDLLAGAVRDGE